MPTTQIAKPDGRTQPENLANWVVTILACILIAWMGVSSYRFTATCAALYDRMYMKLWGSAQFLIQNYRWFYPSLFGSALALLITKQVLVRSKGTSFFLSLITAGAFVAIAYGIIRILYLPIEELPQQLHQ